MMERLRKSMKVDRLYAITVFLMNHGRTSAKDLAKHFEVSIRTIQRDIDSLCSAGIPVVAITGINGGYELTKRFTLNNQIISQKDYSYILTALNGLSSATNNPEISNIYEKIISLTDENDVGMILDFSVLQEGNSRFLSLIQLAVTRRKAVRFSYTNSLNEKRIHIVEPIAVIYRWYSWYLLAYSIVKDDYRTYKLLRMDDLEITEEDFSKEHDSPQNILTNHDKNNTVTHTKITVKCNPDFITKAYEYLNGKVIKYLDNDMAIMELSVVENEQLWLGTLLSFGDNIEILSPRHIKEKLVSCADKIISLYQKL